MWFPWVSFILLSGVQNSIPGGRGFPENGRLNSGIIFTGMGGGRFDAHLRQPRQRYCATYVVRLHLFLDIFLPSLCSNALLVAPSPLDWLPGSDFLRMCTFLLPEGGLVDEDCGPRLLSSGPTVEKNKEVKFFTNKTRQKNVFLFLLKLPKLRTIHDH